MAGWLVVVVEEEEEAGAEGGVEGTSPWRLRTMF